MRAPFLKPIAIIMMSAALLAAGVASAHAEEPTTDVSAMCATPNPSAVTVDPVTVDGLDLDTCDVVGVNVEAGDVGVVVPEAGTTVTALAEVADGGTFYLEVAVSEAGEVSVSTTEPEMDYGKFLPDGSFQELSAQEANATISAAAYSRCTDYSYTLSSGNWRPATLYLNSNERLPGTSRRPLLSRSWWPR